MSRPGASVVRLYRLLGPGILFAAAAIGVSHLVQSTRAGAIYGLAMLPFLLAACVAKYPSLLFGLRYPAATGRTLLANYRDQGLWAIGAYLLLAVYAMWFVLAAVTVTTAGLLQALLGGPDNILAASAVVLTIAAGIVLAGRYQGLEHVSKILLGLLALLLPVATLLVIPQVDFSGGAWMLPAFDLATVAFIIALAGWMPIPIDASVMSSAWAASRNAHLGERTSVDDAATDFNVGYGLTVVFAICFVLLGAGVVHAEGGALPQGAGPFAALVIELFTSQLGAWSYPLIAVVAFVTMFTTLLTVLDGQIRVLTHAGEVLGLRTDKLHAPGVVVFSLGGLGVLAFLMQDFATFINFATSLGFLLAPLIVVLNHRAMFGADVPEGLRPGAGMRWWSVLGGAALCATSGVYFFIQLQ